MFIDHHQTFLQDKIFLAQLPCDPDGTEAEIKTKIIFNKISLIIIIFIQTTNILYFSITTNLFQPFYFIINQPYLKYGNLEGFHTYQQIIFLSGFAKAVRTGTSSERRSGYLVEGSVATTTAHVAQIFRANNIKNPRLDQDGKTSFMLQEQFRGYRNLDGAKQK